VLRLPRGVLPLLRLLLGGRGVLHYVPAGSAAAGVRPSYERAPDAEPAVQRTGTGTAVTTQIALVLDCDGTMAADTTTLLVEKALGESKEFWFGVNEMVASGWDPPLAWTVKLLREADRTGVEINAALLEEVATKIMFFDGALDLQRILTDYTASESKRSKVEATISLHVVTSGFEDLLVRSRLKSAVTEIWGGQLEFDPGSGRAVGPKSVVTFTEKTKFVFAVNKGVGKAALRQNSARVNDLVPRTARPVPFRNMIYVGDGLTDIPCYSLIQQSGGAAVGVRREATPAEVGDAGSEPRLWNYRPRWGPFHPDYREESDLVLLLKDLIHDALIRNEPG